MSYEDVPGDDFVEPEYEYEHMTNADVMTYQEMEEEDRDAEFRLDAEDEARALAAEQDQAAEQAGDEETFLSCNGYSPDTWCGICEDCQEAQQEERDLYGEPA